MAEETPGNGIDARIKAVGPQLPGVVAGREVVHRADQDAVQIDTIRPGDDAEIKRGTGRRLVSRGLKAQTLPLHLRSGGRAEIGPVGRADLVGARPGGIVEIKCGERRIVAEKVSGAA